MEPDHIISIRRGLRWVIAVSLVAIAGLLIAAVAMKQSDALRTNTLLTFVGLVVAALLADIHVGAARRSPRWVMAGVTAIVASQVCYLLWVWTGLAMESLLYRLWWISMVPSVTSAHMLALRAVPTHGGTGRGDLIERGTPMCVMALGLILMGFALYTDLPPQLGPVHLWLTVLLAATVFVGSFVTWRRWARLQARPAAMSRGAGIAWLCVSHLSLLSVGLYIGRTSAPTPSPFERLPSALADVPPEQIDTQVRADLKRLKTLTARIEDLTQRAAALEVQLKEHRAAEGRNYYLPKEEDDIRWQFFSYLSIRTALLRLATTYAGFEVVADPDLKARCFTVGYAAGMTAFQTSLKFVRTYEDTPLARKKLNEAEPQWDMPPGMYELIFESVTNQHNLNLAAEMAAYFESKRAAWREANIWPVEDFEWLETLIERGVRYVDEHHIGAGRAWVDRFMERVKKDAYTPTYVAQAMVAKWIGDTRIVEQEPLITIAQIEAIESELRPGDILLERRNWCLSNAFLPGFWPHAALYVGRIEDLRGLGIVDDDAVKKKLEEYLEPAPDGHAHTVIEALSEGVIFNSLTESMHADYVAVLRPNVPQDQIAQAIVEAFRHTGKPYDFEFDFSTSDKLVCTELVYRSYDGILHFDLVNIVGRPTLPALEIVHKFAREQQQQNPELEFVLFLDGDRAAGRARRASVEEFCESANRPGTFNE
ncbi:MAG: hypothetical protein IID34_17550 [Planctomycetes bacterium]|nr:hypothetical protein [Planctomycetota bacterium]MCH8967792.1 hypothetical protein [Planctomycetota bacterium]